MMNGLARALLRAAGTSLSDELMVKDREIQKLRRALEGSQAEASAAWAAVDEARGLCRECGGSVGDSTQGPQG